MYTQQLVGIGEPQLSLTILALEVLMNFSSVGSFMYWQMHDLGCSLSLSQHSGEGGVEVVKAAAHGTNSITLQHSATGAGAGAGAGADTSASIRKRLRSIMHSITH